MQRPQRGRGGIKNNDKKDNNTGFEDNSCSRLSATYIQAENSLQSVREGELGVRVGAVIAYAERPSRGETDLQGKASWEREGEGGKRAAGGRRGGGERSRLYQALSSCYWTKLNEISKAGSQ